MLISHNNPSRHKLEVAIKEISLGTISKFDYVLHIVELSLIMIYLLQVILL